MKFKLLLASFSLCVVGCASANVIHPYVGAMTGPNYVSDNTVLAITGFNLAQRDALMTEWQGYFYGGALFQVTPRFSLAAEFGYGATSAT